MLIQGGSRLSSEVQVAQRGFRAHVMNSSLGSILFTWDGDRHPEILSGGGLRCLNLTQSDASAIVLKDFSLHGVCEGEECPPFIIETRLYDASDPTGQVYSASILKRSNDRPSTDLLVPFSNFSRSGPRGSARLSCVGAISMQVKFESFSDVVLEMGAVFTNSLVPMEVVGQGAFPADEVVVESPSPAETEEPTPTPTAPPLPANVIPRAPIEQESIDSPPSASATSQEGSSGAGGTTSVAGPLTEPTPTNRPIPRPRGEEPDEVVFGEVIKR